MAGMTNRGKKLRDDTYFRGAAAPTTFYLALVTSAVAPNPDTNTLSDLTEIANGNGYTTGGKAVARNSTDFDVLTEDDANDKDILQIINQTWTASGGDLPASGSGARYAVLIDDNATVGSRQVILYWDLTSNRTVSTGQALTLVDLEIDSTE